MPKAKKSSLPRPEPSPDRQRYVALYHATKAAFYDIGERASIIGRMYEDLQRSLMDIEEALANHETDGPPGFRYRDRQAL